MAWKKKTEGLISIIQQGRVCRPTLCGQAICGWSECGEDFEMGGVYEMRRKRSGIWKWGNGQFGKASVCVKAHYWPNNPKTENQVICQDKFALAVSAWQALTSEQKLVYNQRAKGRVLSGYNLFIREYLYG
jgi:hypothetical protein